MSAAAGSPLRHAVLGRWLRIAFVRVGVLPLLLAIAVILFAFLSERFVTWANITNVLRQSSYLTIVAMGQMLVLRTGGFDLAVGTQLAITSVVSALTMSGLYAAMPDAIWLAIVLGMLAGLGAGLLIGLVNGVGVATFNVSPFIMTLGMASVGFGIALYLTAGMPVRGLPYQYADTFGSGGFLGLRSSVWIAAILAVIVYLLVSWMRFGRYLYAVGGNLKAAQLSGVDTRRTLFYAYVLCAGLTSIAGLMLTARMETGEANIGSSMPLESIAACVIGGVSLRGGIGRLEFVILGAIFIGVVQNGMNLARVESYLQIVVTGMILIVAVIADESRRRIVARLQD
jgi:ribose/xylose/arabinose/galactoside ABC-type transport system permease subunit